MFQKGYVAYFGPPTHIVCNQDPAFTSSLMEAFTEQLNIKMIMVSPTNHKSLLAEHGIKSLSTLLAKFRSERTDLMNKNKVYHAYEVGQIVYMYQAKGSVIQTGSRKIACYFVGPLVIYKAIGPNQFLLMSLTGEIYPHLIEETKLKPGSIWTSKGNVSTLAELKQVLSTNIQLGQ